MAPSDITPLSGVVSPAGYASVTPTTVATAQANAPTPSQTMVAKPDGELAVEVTITRGLGQTLTLTDVIVPPTAKSGG